MKNHFAVKIFLLLSITSLFFTSCTSPSTQTTRSTLPSSTLSSSASSSDSDLSSEEETGPKTAKISNYTFTYDSSLPASFTFNIMANFPLDDENSASITAGYIDSAPKTDDVDTLTAYIETQTNVTMGSFAKTHKNVEISSPLTPFQLGNFPAYRTTISLDYEGEEPAIVELVFFQKDLVLNTFFYSSTVENDPLYRPIFEEMLASIE